MYPIFVKIAVSNGENDTCTVTLIDLYSCSLWWQHAPSLPQRIGLATDLEKNLEVDGKLCYHAC